MSLGQRLEVRQGQSLVMTPQLQQAIKLLQLTNLELAEFVEAELERNPLLVRDDGAPGGEAEPADTPAEASAGGDLPELSINEAGPTEGADGALDADYESLNPDAAMADAPSAGGAVDWSRSSGGGGEGDVSALDLAAADKSLHDHLSEQLALSAHTPSERLIGAALIEAVDDDGYLRVDLDEIAERLGAPRADVDALVTVMQGFDPSGVMARDLKECLALQLKDRDRFDPAMAALVENLELLASHDYRKLRALCGVSDDDLEDMIGELRALTPKPGLSFGGAPPQTVEPDVAVRPLSSGAWAVELNSDTLPKVLVDGRYYAEVSRAARSDEEKTFISECHQTAGWLVRSLDQRARTILKVAQEIVRQQDGFLAEGVSKLRPLNLKTVAEAIEMHESTVSRVTSNKHIATPRGVFEMKYFFTAAIPSSGGGEAHSAEAVRHRIRALIEAETVDTVLSDDRIVELLRDDGIEIARRTVAKYREAMRIPSSVQRRRMLRRAS